MYFKKLQKSHLKLLYQTPPVSVFSSMMGVEGFLSKLASSFPHACMYFVTQYRMPFGEE